MSRSSAARSSRACRTSASASGRSASRTASASDASSAMLSRSAAVARALAAAAASTVVPQRPAWMRSSASPGYHSSRNASLNVPRPRASRRSPQSTSSRLRRCRSRLRSRSISRRRSSVMSLRLRLGLQPQAPLQPVDVLLQRDHRRLLGHLAEAVADHELGAHERQRDVGAVAQHGAGRVEQLVEARERPLPHAGQSARQPRRIDHLRGGGIEPLRAQQPRRAAQPARDREILRLEELVVPGRRVDARAVAALAGEQRVGPRHPGGRDLDLRQPLQRPLIRRGGAGSDERRRVPGAADDRDRVVDLRVPCGSSGACTPRGAPRRRRGRGTRRAAPPSPR